MSISHFPEKPEMVSILNHNIKMVKFFAIIGDLRKSRQETVRPTILSSTVCMCRYLKFKNRPYDHKGLLCVFSIQHFKRLSLIDSPRFSLLGDWGSSQCFCNSLLALHYNKIRSIVSSSLRLIRSGFEIIF